MKPEETDIFIITNILTILNMTETEVMSYKMIALKYACKETGKNH